MRKAWAAAGKVTGTAPDTAGRSTYILVSLSFEMYSFQILDYETTLWKAILK